MQQGEGSGMRAWRYACEFAFGMYLAFLLRLELEPTGLLRFVEFVSATKLQVAINSQLHKGPESQVGAWWAFYVLATALGVIIFLLVEAISIAPLGRRLLVFAIGPLTVLLLPLHWLYNSGILIYAIALPNPPHVWLWLELVTAVSCAIFYAVSPKGWHIWAGVTLLVLHFNLWGWLFLGGASLWRGGFECAFPLLGLLSGLAWGIYRGKGAHPFESNLSARGFSPLSPESRP